MIYSMTAYCHQNFTSEQGTLTIELRSVNHRFLELTLKLSEELRTFESTIRSTLNRLLRGKVECRISLASLSSSDYTLRYDTQKLETVCTTLRDIQKTCPESAWPSLDALLQFPGVRTADISSNTLSEDTVLNTLLESVDTAINHLENTRAAEGEKIKALLLDRVKECRKTIQPLSDQADRLTQQYLERLQARLNQLALEIDPERLSQEASLQALRSDVREELDRLIIHLDAVETALSEGGSIGKRLDFLMQELNREANTLASKAADIDITQSALQLKLLIEQMREQIQNLL